MRLVVLLLLATSLPAASPLVGRWNFNMPNGRATWLGITEKSGALEVWYQPTGGNVYQVNDVKADGAHLTLTLGKPTDKAPRTVLELDVQGDRITGKQTRGSSSQDLTGTRAPALKRPMPKAWATPVALFNGRDLSGWEPLGKVASHWTVEEGFLLNKEKGANLRTKDSFQDFKLHFEVNGPDHANSGFYLRGRYEVQLEYEPLKSNPPERRLGSIYGRIAPKGDLPRTPGTWEVFDVTLVGRTLTVVRNGVTTIDRQEIEGITGGALDANEAEPGPFYIQGDHTGGLKFRNITVSVPKP
ncbi:MAG: DUF1080 domain-containing protein [Bryobacteraceae bacterium]|nr:DUF1080 domain-containing protein [Bryobacteraceae bacterium]